MPCIFLQYDHLIVQIPYGHMTMECAQEVRKYSEKIAGAGFQYLWFTDTRHLQVPKPDVRRELSNADLPSREFMEHTKRGHLSVIVLDSAIARGALTALSWMYRNRPLIKTAKDARGGLAILKDGGGLTLPTLTGEIMEYLDEISAEEFDSEALLKQPWARRALDAFEL